MIKSFFPDACYNRGVAYYEEDRVWELGIATQKISTVITANVDGSSEDYYITRVELAKKIRKNFSK